MDVDYIFSEQPTVYRPGHYLRPFPEAPFCACEPPTGGTRFGPGKKVSVEIDDPDQKPVYQKTLTVSAAGSIHDDLQLAPAAALGSYFIQVKRPGSAEPYGDVPTGSFDVEAYRKPEYEVRVTPAKGRVLQGETGHATIDARYFFGEPVSGAKVKYSVYRSRYWFPLWYDPDDQPDQEGDQSDDYFAGDQVSEQSGMLDADGKLQIDIPTEVTERGFDTLYRVEAHVTDSANREIAGTGRIVASHGDFVLNVTPDKYVYEFGSQATVTVEARDYDSQPVHAKVHLELSNWNRNDSDENRHFLDRCGNGCPGPGQSAHSGTESGRHLPSPRHIEVHGRP